MENQNSQAEQPVATSPIANVTNTPGQQKRKLRLPEIKFGKLNPLVYVSIAGLVVLLLIVAVFSKGAKQVLNKLGFYSLLRSTGIARTNAPDFYAAVDSQNLVYDYNRDGIVSYEDYPQFVAARTWWTRPTATPTATPTPTPTDITLDTPTVPTESTTANAVEGGVVPLPSTKAFGSDVFNGSATVDYPIESPPSYAGIAPSLSLSYSSGSVDDMFVGIPTGYRDGDTKNYPVQASLVGLGWNLSGFGNITRDRKGTETDPTDDTFILSFSGGSANLVMESGDDNYSVWRTSPNLLLKVERIGRCKIHVDTNERLCRYHWVVTSGDGTKYTFGSDTTIANWRRSEDLDATINLVDENGLGDDWYPLYDDSSGKKIGYRAYESRSLKNSFQLYMLTYKWPLTKVQSIYDYKEGVITKKVEMIYQTEFETGQSVGTNNTSKFVKATYPSKISYPKTEIVISREPRLDYKTNGYANNAEQTLVASDRIRKIVVQRQDKNGNWQAVKAYTLNYVYGWRPGEHNDDGDGIVENINEVVAEKAIHSLLTKITAWDSDPDTNSAAKRLPAQTFSYGANCSGLSGGCPLYAMYRAGLAGQTRTPNDFFLASADNGQGGKVDFEYWSDDGSNGKALNVKYCDPDKLTPKDFEGGANLVCLTDNAYNTQRHRLAAQILHDGMGSTTRTGYEYTGANANIPIAYVKSYGRDASDSDSAFAGFEFLGYPEVTVRVYDQNSTQLAAQTTSYYYQAMETSTCFKPSPLKGVAYRTLTYNADNTSQWNQEDTDYTVRFGDMFGTTSDVTAANLSSYCPNYNPEETVSQVLATQSVAKAIMPSPQLCTKTTTNYNNLDGSKDPYAMPHTSIAWGKVNCSTLADDTADSPRYALSNYTNADTVRWLLPKPSESWASNSATGSKYQHSRTLYDNQLPGNLGNYGRVTETQTLVGNTISSVYATNKIAYDPTYSWQVTQATDAEGHNSYTTYDNLYHIYPTSVTNALGQTAQTEYDFSTGDSSLSNYNGVLGLPVKTTDANNQTSTMVYDTFGRLTATYLPGKSPATGSKPSSFYAYYYFNEDDISPCGNETNCLVGLGKQISGQYGPKTMYSQASRYNDTGTSGTFGGSHTYYNGIGQTVQTRQVWTENDWNNEGFPVDGEGLRDIVTSVAYDALGATTYSSLPYTTAPYASYPQNSYDNRNLVTDGGIKKIQNTYDGFGRQIQTYYPDGTREEIVYDINGNPLVQRIRDKNCTDTSTSTHCTEKTTTSNAFGQLVKEELKDPSSKLYTTTYTYHPVLGLLQNTTDTNNTLVSKVDYDELGRKTRMWDIDMSPDMTNDTSSWRYQYNKTGNLTKQTDPKNQVTILTYDSLYRLTQKQINGTKTLANTYDTCANGVGRLCQNTSYNPANGQELARENYVYDNRGRVQSMAKRLSNMPDSQVNGVNFTETYTYDEGGRVLTTQYSAASTLGVPGEIVTNNYTRNYLTGTTSNTYGTQYAKDAKFNKDGQLLSFKSGNNVTNSYSYDANNLRMTNLNISGSNFQITQPLQLSYTYDPVGNITKITDTNTAKTASNVFKLTQTFTYDPLKRLQNVSADAYTASYSYDNIGNISTKLETPRGGDAKAVNLSYTGTGYYHRPNSVETYELPTVVLDSTTTTNYTNTTYRYDAIGNLLEDENNTYEYDTDNRLVRAVSKQTLATPTPTPITETHHACVNNACVIVTGAGADSCNTDNDCLQSTPSPTPTTSLGDANGDGVIDDADYDLWHMYYGTVLSANPEPDELAVDFNADGVVDGLDYMIWRTNYSGWSVGQITIAPTTAATATPTPTPKPVATSTPTPTPKPTATATPKPTVPPILTTTPAPLTCSDVGGTCRSSCYWYQTTYKEYACSAGVCCINKFQWF